MTVRTELLMDRRRKRLTSALAVSLLMGSTCMTTGCSSTGGSRLASINPFARSAAPSASGEEKAGFTQSVASGITKSRETVVGWFGKKEEGPEYGVKKADESDPTSLASTSTVSPEVFVANGRLWESTGNFEKAMENYAKALEQRPDDPGALSNIARLHFRQGNHPKAAEYFGKAIEQKADDAGLHNDLGLTYSKMGNHTAAVRSLSRALQLSPKSSRYANNLASVKFEARDHAGALEVLVKNNKPAVAHFNMAYLHFKHQQSVEATRHLNQALAYKPQATADPATKRAIERAGELLAQIGPINGFEPGTAIAAANVNKAASPAPGSATPVLPKPNLPTPNLPGQTASSTLAVGAKVTGFENMIQPASTGKTAVSFGPASYKTPAPQTGVNQTSASVETPAAPTQTAPTQTVPTQTASDTDTAENAADAPAPDAPTSQKTIPAKTTGFVMPAGF